MLRIAKRKRRIACSKRTDPISSKRLCLDDHDELQRKENKSISVEILKFMIDADIDWVAFKLLMPESGLKELLSSSCLNNEMIELLIKVFEKMCRKENSMPCFGYVLGEIVDSSFLNVVATHFHDFETKCNIESRNFLSCCLCLMQWLLIKFPKKSVKKVSLLYEILKKCMLNLDIKGFQLQEIYTQFNELIEKTKEREKAQEKEFKKTTKYMMLKHKEEPPDNFREISVFPTTNDIHLKNNPFVRTNLVNSHYSSVDHYLDVQFRLLREDFIRPLREGITEFFQSDKSRRFDRKQRIKCYDNVSIVKLVVSQQGIMHELNIKVAGRQNTKSFWNKKLKYGNVVCLSSDDFQNDILFAVITNRDPVQLLEGTLYVQFKPEYNEEEEIFLIDMSKTYLMIETEAYFECYRYVLEGLQEIKSDMPMKNYIVDCITNIISPNWVQELADKFDITPVLKNQLLKKGKKKLINVLDPTQWPNEEALGLDVSQKNALQAALTNQLAIIQGPPGTGKTYLGLLIMKLLLTNLLNCPTKGWPIHKSFEENTTPKPKHLPILVVCYTNHALDQFLEGITEFSPDEKIVRVGGRCNNPKLKKFLLKNVKNYNAKHGDFISESILKYINGIDDDIIFNKKVLESLSDTVIKLEILKPVIADEVLDKFCNKYKKLDDQKLVKWLEIAPTNDQSLLKFPHVFQEMLCYVSRKCSKHNRYTKKGFKISVNVSSMPHKRTVTNTEETIVPPKAYCEKKQMQYKQDAIRNKLNSVEVPLLSAKKLKSRGYHDLEIRCAYYILGHHTPLPDIQEWINQRASMHDFERGFDSNAQVSNDEMKESCDDLESEEEQVNTGFQKFHPNFSRDKIAVTYHCEDINGLDLGIVKFYKFREEINNGEIMSKNEFGNLPAIHKLTLEDRWRLYRYWIKELRIKLKEKIQSLQAESHKLAERLTLARKHEDFQVLKKANVIGMTTTGAAKHRSIVQNLPVKVVIVEEAAEVLEAHIVTAMPRTTEHLILIGDHQQLQPSTAVYELATKYNLNMSLFERLIKNGIPFTKLSQQHRMRPQIADLIRPNIYEELNDNSRVLNYENVKGIQKNVFFITHNIEEQSVHDGRGKVNVHEVKFLIELFKYLLNQGYQKHQITILTMYTGQVLNLKNRISDREVKITSVDNYQGEENEIILLSLVRSNENADIGFLKIKNRICVALSRAKIGLYCIGNFEILQENKWWKDIVEKLKKNDCFGYSLPLITGCKMHPSHKISVKHAMDFPRNKYGGCGDPCQFRLECGHVCPQLCHPLTNHSKVVCKKPCTKKCSNGHPCVNLCYERCGLCHFKIKKVRPKCNHELNMPCYKNPNNVECTFPCEKTLKCGHPCTSKCGDECSTLCQVKVEVTLNCGHPMLVNCSQNNFLQIKTIMVHCTHPCTATLECGHQCTGTCSRCHQGRMHKFCNTKCTRMNLCGHPCQDYCCDQCSPCQKTCEMKCEHSDCLIKCSKPCPPCQEKCKWRCKHYKCSKLCGEPCDRPPCNKPCQRRLKPCGHPCIGLCGELCPYLCRICDKEKVTEIFFGDEDDENARFVELDCGHIFTYESLDHWMYKDINATEDSENPVDKTIQLKRCPKCNTVIRRSRRYKGIINEQLSLMNEVRKKINSLEYIKKKKSELITKLSNQDYSTLNSELDKYRDRILSAYSLSEMTLLEMQVDMVSHLSKLRKNIRSIGLSNLQIEVLLSEIVTLSNFMLKAKKYYHKQIVSDINWEYKRIIAKMQACTAYQKYSGCGKTNKNLSDNINIILTLSDGISRYDEKKELKLNEIFQTIKTQFVEQGIGILTMEEQNMIIKAMDFQNKGHWFKCKNGHVYAIGDCGGAEQKSICPDCKEEIGGQQHRLVEGNSVAREMDGATRSAYDEAAALNLVPENLRFD